ECTELITIDTARLAAEQQRGHNLRTHRVPDARQNRRLARLARVVAFEETDGNFRIRGEPSWTQEGYGVAIGARMERDVGDDPLYFVRTGRPADSDLLEALRANWKKVWPAVWKKLTPAQKRVATRIRKHKGTGPVKLSSTDRVHKLAIARKVRCELELQGTDGKGSPDSKPTRWRRASAKIS